MRVCIVGAGAIGSFLGAHLSRSGGEGTAFAEQLRSAGFKASVSARIQADVWYGLRGNMTMNPICTGLAREVWGSL